MMYSEQDIKDIRNQLIRRILFAVLLLLIPNLFSLLIMNTVRIEWLSIILGIVGGALAIFYLALYIYPVYSYWQLLREIVNGRTHEFTGVLTEIAQDSVREGVPCKTLYFCDDADNEQRLCYWDLYKYVEGGCKLDTRYDVTVHGQNIIRIHPV